MKIAVDIDGVLCEPCHWTKYNVAKPIDGAANGVQRLVDTGHDIFYFTARPEADRNITKLWLRKHSFPMARLVMDKPLADRYIDDRAICFTRWKDVRDLTL